MIEPYLEFLKHELGSTTYLAYVAQQQLRDGDQHHATIVNTNEYPQLEKFLTLSLLKYPIEISLLGVGHIVDDDNETYFIVCESPGIQAIRAYLGLPPTDPHITLGFKISDIYDKRKDRGTLLQPFGAIENHESHSFPAIRPKMII